LYLAQCSQVSTVLLAGTKLRHVHWIARQRSVIRHSREHVSFTLHLVHFVTELLLCSAASTLL
ncbi:unnamed protein product, partial [Staurois parvus]